MQNDTRKSHIVTLLKNGIEQGDAAALDVISSTQYIQHNPLTVVERDGLAALFKQISASSPSVTVARIFADGDYVFAHTEYDFTYKNIGFEIFKFDGDVAVEHWDNIQRRPARNPSDRSMIDGQTEVTDIDLTEQNRATVTDFVNQVLVARDLNVLSDYIPIDEYIEHNPDRGDGIDAYHQALAHKLKYNYFFHYNTVHMILAEGNFVLSVCEGTVNGEHCAFYDLFRLEHDMIVEHWDTTEVIPPKNEWKNDNGKF